MDNMRHVNEPGEAPPVGRPVPLRVLRSAEIEARRWKMRAELLSALVKRAGACGALPDEYVTQASRIMAGTI